jgi:transcriptional regulator with XRE-family HTH domain
MQTRAARGLLRWTQERLAREAGVSLPTIANYEAEKTQPIPATLEMIRQALERAGIEFNADGRGVRLRPERPRGGRRPK